MPPRRARMEIKALQKGATLWLESGSVVEVIAPSDDGTTVCVRYIESAFDEALVVTESDCTDYDHQLCGPRRSRRLRGARLARTEVLDAQR